MDVLEVASWCLLLLIFLASAFYLYGTWTFDYWKKRGVPYVKPTLLGGPAFDALMARRTLSEIYREMYKELDPHPYGGFFDFREPALLLRDPELIKCVLTKDFYHFYENAFKIDINLDPIFGRNPVVLAGERWRITRSLLTPAFSSGKLKPLFPLMLEVCEELKSYLENEKNSGDGTEVKELCANFTTNVVASCVFGIQGDALQNPKSEIREVGRSILQPGFLRNMVITLVTTYPTIAKLLRLRFSTKEADRFFERVTREVLDHREKTNTTRNDFIQLLINIKNKQAALNKEENFDPMEFAPEKHRFTNIDIIAQAVTFFTDGFETASIAFYFCLYELAMHPEVQEKLYREVEESIEQHDGQLTFDAIQQNAYLDMVVSETLRMHPPTALILKRCTKPYDLKTPSGGTYTVEVGTSVHIPTESLHYDPRYYPEPEKFDPERFSEENKSNINKYTYLPFGEGPRMCIGYRFGLMQVKAGTAYLLHHFEIRPNSRTPNSVALDPTYFLSVAKDDIYLDFVKRNNS